MVAPDRILVRPRSYYPSMKGAEAEARAHPEYLGWKLVFILVVLAAFAVTMIAAFLR